LVSLAKNVDVVEAFFNGQSNVKTTNLYIEDNKLVNYATTLAERVPQESGEYHFIINETKYSRSTSAIQTMIRRCASSHSHKTVDGKPMGTFRLQPSYS
jgi:hypothetical protein